MRARSVVAAVVLACVAAGCTTPADNGVNGEATPELEVVSWWTSGSEEQALTTLVDSYRAAHSGVTVTDATVAGGGGGNAQVVLAQRLLAGDQPDVWQTFPGGALSRYADQNEVLDVSSLYSSGLSAALPKTILDGLTVDGKQYGVPTSAHRGNVLFYNRKLLADAGISAPTQGYREETFRDDLETLAQAGTIPLCLGAKDRFTTAALFENVLLSEVGAAGWDSIRADRFDWSSTQVRAALTRFGTILDRADPQAAALSWDAATRKLAGGECAFETINDSALGELLEAGAVEGTDFGAVSYPGTDDTYMAVVDTFVVGREAKNQRNGSDFLATVAGPETQLAFSRAKGSVPVRTDVDVSSLTPYQREAAEALRTKAIAWSIVHGEATSPQFQAGFYDAVETYVRSRDARAFTDTLTDALRQQPPAK